jgi:hypothetical protein
LACENVLALDLRRIQSSANLFVILESENRYRTVEIMLTKNFFQNGIVVCSDDWSLKVEYGQVQHRVPTCVIALQNTADCSIDSSITVGAIRHRKLFDRLGCQKKFVFLN